MRIIFIISLSLFFVGGIALAEADWLPEDITYEGDIFRRDTYWKDYEQTEFEDLDGDGKKEIIVRFKTEDRGSLPTAVTAIYEVKDGKKEPVKIIWGGETPTSMELSDIDGDSLKDLIIYDHAGNHYTLIMIYSYKEGKYKQLFKNGTPCYLHKVVTDESPPKIIIGRENWDDEEFCYANSDEKSLEETYIWNGKEFIYSKKLSTTPYIGEKQALEITWQSMKKALGKMEGGPYEELKAEYAIKAWNGGTRAMELFEKDREEASLKVREKLLKQARKRLKVINKKLDEKLEDAYRAFLLAEKAAIILTLSEKDPDLLKATQLIITALKLDPQSKKHKELLSGVYKDLWKDKQIRGNGKITKQLKAMKNNVKILVDTYKVTGELSKK